MYRIVIDELVLKKDFKKIDLLDQRKIINAIRRKLTTKPDVYGEPLRGELRRFWKLRVGEYRVIYEIQEEQVLIHVLLVGFRRDEEVYKKALSRLGSA
jgi:mRNA interferase RelE/StbE